MSWQINISSDSMVASLDLRKHNNSIKINSKSIIEALQEKNIPVNQELEQNISQVLAELESSDKSTEMPVLFRGIDPVDGKNGFFEWSEKCDLEKHKIDNEPTEDADRTSFYNRSSLIIVNKGDLLYKILLNVYRTYLTFNR